MNQFVTKNKILFYEEIALIYFTYDVLREYLLHNNAYLRIIFFIFISNNTTVNPFQY